MILSCLISWGSIPGLYQRRSQTQGCQHRGKGDKLRDAVFACLVFALQCDEGGKLEKILKISIYGKLFVFE